MQYEAGHLSNMFAKIAQPHSPERKRFRVSNPARLRRVLEALRFHLKVSPHTLKELLKVSGRAAVTVGAVAVIEGVLIDIAFDKLEERLERREAQAQHDTSSLRPQNDGPKPSH